MTSSEAPAAAPAPAPPRRPWRLWAAAAAVVLLGVVLRVAVSGPAALHRGDEALTRGDELVAALEWRAAISWTLPVGATWRDEAAERLWKLHEAQLARGDLPDAVQTLTLLRAGLFASRTLLGVDPDWRARVDAALVPLLVRWEAEAAATEQRPLPDGDRLAYYQARYASDWMPNPWLGLLAVLGFFGWLALTFSATAHDGPARWRRLGLSALPFAAFALSLAYA